jgi:hypothetical protein
LFFSLSMIWVGAYLQRMMDGRRWRVLKSGRNIPQAPYWYHCMYYLYILEPG